MQKVDKKLIKEFMTAMTNLRKLMMGFQDNSADNKPATHLQFHGLTYISENPNTTIGDLAKVCKMTSGAVAQFVARLENSGWVTKRPDTEDKRIMHLELSDEGKKELKRMHKKFMVKVEEILSLIPESDLKELIRIQKVFITNLEKRK